MTRVSVITICWNDREGLDRTIASVRAQTWADIEHIVVDGGSSDGTRELLESTDGSVHWVSESDRGRYDAMNKGVAMASGDLVWFMNSADVFASAQTVEAVAAMADRSWRWGYGLSRVRDGDVVRAIKGDVPFNAARFFLGGRIIPHQAAVFERTLHHQIGGYDVEFGLSADQLYMMKAALLSPPMVWTDFFCDFDASGVGSARGAWAHFRDVVRARRRIQATVTGSPTADEVLSVGLALATKSERAFRRVTVRWQPRLGNPEAGPT